MDFIDKVKAVAMDAAVTTGKKSRELYDITKLKLAIADKQKSVKTIYKEIGFNAYKAYCAKTDIVDCIKDKLEKIDSLEDEIANLRKQLANVGEAEQVGIDDIFDEDSDAEEADFVAAESQKEFDEAEAEPIEPIE